MDLGSSDRIQLKCVLGVRWMVLPAGSLTGSCAHHSFPDPSTKPMVKITTVYQNTCKEITRKMSRPQTQGLTTKKVLWTRSICPSVLWSTFKYPTRRSVHWDQKENHMNPFSAQLLNSWPCCIIPYKIWLPPNVMLLQYFLIEDNDDSLFLFNWSN